MGYKYDKVKLAPKEIKKGEYKKHLGGGAKHWETRGAFQLELLRTLGLKPEDTFFDVGCGPIRAGVHFIKYLNPGNYWGVDFNESFIEAAKLIIEENNLQAYEPHVSVLNNFDFGQMGRTFDYIFSFSVLNHCTDELRNTYLERAPLVMDENSRLIVTHSGWYDESKYSHPDLKLVAKLKSEEEIPGNLKFEEWGFKDVDDKLPILEFRRV